MALAGLLSGHSAWVEHCAFNTDLKLLASCSGDGSVVIWDIEAMQRSFALEGHQAQVWSCHWHPTLADFLCSTSSDCSIIIWDVKKKKGAFTLSSHEDTVWCARFSPNGTLLVSTSTDKTARLWECGRLPEARPELLGIVERRGDVVEFADFSPDGKMLCVVGRDSVIRLWTVKPEEAAPVDVNAVETSSSSSLSDREQLSPVCDSSLSDVVNLGDYSLFSYCRLKRRRAWVRACAFSPSKFKLLATCTNDGRMCVWNVETRTLVHELNGHTNVVWGCTFFVTDDDELLLASCSSDQTLR